uniref:Subtilisin inhibitor 1 n=1 Tax=Triticum urartu TaxID=4572 RepID=A0A8R7JVM9_TRIUA
MPKVPGEAKRTLWRANSSNVYKYHGFSWPRVVGLKVHNAKRIIRKGKPELHFEVLPENAMRSCVSRNFHVTLIVDKHNRVVETPHV